MSDSGNFPRVTYCDLDVRILGTVQKHTVQCVLIINIFTEKVFIMLWIWYSFLMAFSIFSLFNWLLRMIPSEARMSFIARRLELADIGFKRELYAEELEEFVQKYIKMDGVFVLRMLTIHAGVLACTEVVDNLWEEFKLLTANTAEPKDEDDTFTENQGTKQEAAPRPNEKAPLCSCAARQPLLPQQRKKVPVLAPLMTRHDPYYYSQFHGGQPGDPLATSGGGGALSMLGGRGGGRGGGSNRMAVHRPSTTSMSASRFNLRPIGFPSRFSGGGSSRRSSIERPGGNEGGGAMRQAARGSEHNLLTSQLNLGSTATSSAVPTISANEPLSQYNWTEEQYMQNGEQERLVDENEL